MVKMAKMIIINNLVKILIRFIFRFTDAKKCINSICYLS